MPAYCSIMEAWGENFENNEQKFDNLTTNKGFYNSNENGSNTKFKIPNEILKEWRKIGEKGISEQAKWNSIYNKKDKKIKDEISRIIKNKLPEGFDEQISSLKKKFFNLKSTEASRKSSAFVLENITKNLPELIGGSADLSG